MKQRYIKDNDGNIVLPITSVTAVRDNEGQTLAAKIEELELKSDGNNNLIKTEESRAKNAESSLHNSVVSTNNALNTERSERTAAEAQLRAELNAKQYEAEAIELDAVPTKDSTKMVNSGAVYTALQDMTYDVSVKHPASGVDSGNTYTLSGAITVIPAADRKAGMSIKFIDFEKNEYVQYRFIGATTNGFTTVGNWERYNDITTSNQRGSDLDFSDEQGNVLVRFQDGGIKTKNFDSSKDATIEERGLMSSADKAKLNTIEDGAEVNDVITGNTVRVDLDISDEQDNVVMRVADGHIKTKNFDSSYIEESNLSSELLEEIVQNDDSEHYCDLEVSDNLDNVLMQLRNGHIKTKNFDSKSALNRIDALENKRADGYDYIGHPSIYIPNSLDTTELSLFPTLQSIYDAYDELCAQYPLWFKREEDIGLDESETYPMRHYTLRMQNPLITNDRAGNNENLWDDSLYKYKRIIVQASIHSDERYSTLGCYLAIKHILESQEDWAVFIKSNFIIDLLPCSNPWGAANGWSSVNVNGYNLNRTYFNNIQAENQNIIDLIQELKPKGLIAVIDCHNTGTGDGYFVAKSTYKYWDYYAVLTQKIQASLYDFTNQVFGTTRLNHFHLWDATGNNGQLHQYADSQGLLGCTFEVKESAGLQGSILTNAYIIDLIQNFGTY